VHLPKQTPFQRLTHESADVYGAEVVQSYPSQIAQSSQIHAEVLVWDDNTGWISWQYSNGSCLPLCWMPVERRGLTFVCRGTSAVLGARQGTLTILDFSNVIAMFGDADQAPFT
jgi:hypothetical protein